MTPEFFTIDDRFNHEPIHLSAQEYTVYPDQKDRKDRVHVYFHEAGIYVTMAVETLHKVFPVEADKQLKEDFIKELWTYIHGSYCDELEIDEDDIWKLVRRYAGGIK